MSVSYLERKRVCRKGYISNEMWTLRKTQRLLVKRLLVDYEWVCFCFSQSLGRLFVALFFSTHNENLLHLSSIDLAFEWAKR
jgi:hypothetical protein